MVCTQLLHCSPITPLQKGCLCHWYHMTSIKQLLDSCSYPPFNWGVGIPQVSIGTLITFGISCDTLKWYCPPKRHTVPWGNGPTSVTNFWSSSVGLLKPKIEILCKNNHMNIEHKHYVAAWLEVPCLCHSRGDRFSENSEWLLHQHEVCFQDFSIPLELLLCC